MLKVKTHVYYDICAELCFNWLKHVETMKKKAYQKMISEGHMFSLLIEGL